MLRVNTIYPYLIAVIVWSLPNDVLYPGLNFVPLCRTRISPGKTFYPPNFLTPNLRPALSLVFWVDDACILDAYRATLINMIFVFNNELH